MKIVSLRRRMLKAEHLVRDARTGHEHNDDPRLVRDDLVAARKLIDDVLKTYRGMARGAARGDSDA